MRSLIAMLKAAVLFLSLCSVTIQMIAQGKTENLARTVEWELASILSDLPSGFSIAGKPRIIDCPYGKAVLFDGQGDALFFAKNPLADLHVFTIEIIFRPDTNGSHEQRFLHMGEVKEDRALVELRLVQNTHWYLDAFLKSGENKLPLMDSTKLHPVNRWYHMAFVVQDGKMESYVNGDLELNGKIPFTPLSKGETSIGVRLNRLSWYKGALYKIRITPMKLQPEQFQMYGK